MQGTATIGGLFSEFISAHVFGGIGFVLQYGWYWMPPLLIYILWHAYRRYILFKYLFNLEWVTLEIKLPREILKSPLAMEIALGAFHQTSDRNWYIRMKEGFVRAWFSLEIVSDGGVIHFYIRTPKFFKDLIESNIYSQYPDVEILPVDDYVDSVPNSALNDEAYEMWGGEFILTKEDPYPIKTYVDYGLERDPKEEFKNDPITPIIEFLGQIKPEEKIWIQILIQAAKKRYRKKDGTMGDWKDEGVDLINKIMKRDEKPAEGQIKIPTISATEKNQTEAIARSISKLGFDCGIRAVYILKKQRDPSEPKGWKKYSPISYVGIIGQFKQFSTVDLNGFKPNNTTSVEYPWQDPFGTRVKKKKRKMLRAYKNRGYFYPPFAKSKPFVLNAEELATIYHFPGGTAETPTFGRIESRRGEPPSNLPI